MIRTTKNIFSYNTVLVLICLFTISCSTPSNTRKPVSIIKITKQSIVGNPVKLSIKVLPKGGKIKQVSLLVNGEKIKELSEEEQTLTIPNEHLHIGRNKIEVVAFKENGKEGRNSKIITLFSSITPQNLEYDVIKILKHHDDHFTEGFEINNGVLYEGTGEYGTSGIYKIDLNNQKIIQSTKLDSTYFGEGITLLNGKIYQLTYKKQKAFVYDDKTLKQIGEFSYPNKEGWGLTNNGKELIMSDGSSNIYFINPVDFSEKRRIQVYSNIQEYSYINELEYVNGYIYANVWTTDLIIKIDAKTGAVVATISLYDLINSSKLKSTKDIDVLNGIAYNIKNKSLYVTGKFWPYIYNIKLKHNGEEILP